MKYARIFADDRGETHFEEVQVELATAFYAPPAPAMDVSATFSGRSVRFVGAPAGWYGAPHPTPVRQFAIILTGVVEVSVSDGTVWRRGPGSVFFLDDTAGSQGHSTRVVGEDALLMAMVPSD